MSLPAGGGRPEETIYHDELFSNEDVDHLPDVGDGGVAADARGVDGEPAGGGGGGGHQVSVVDRAVQVGDTHLWRLRVTEF